MRKGNKIKDQNEGKRCDAIISLNGRRRGDTDCWIGDSPNPIVSCGLVLGGEIL